MPGALDGKIALVTGGRGGVGRAICDRFRREGAVVHAGDLTPDGSIGARSDDHEDGDEGFVELDVTDERSVRAALEQIGTAHGRLDVLVNAAGIEIEATVEHTTVEDWNRTLAVNATGPFLVSKHALPLLRRSPAASIINLGSYDGFVADPGLAAYCASKGAVHALTRAMACDHGPEGIRVNAICPGYVDTPMLRSFFGDAGDIDSLEEAVRQVHPLRTYGTPEDVANLANWLASDEARYASGQLWVLDGGLTAQVQQMRL